MIGTDPANLKLLYGRNNPFRLQVLKHGADALLAAELLIDHKLKDAPSDAALLEMKDQIQSLRSELIDLIGNSQ
jgi:hypothetical protein